MKVDGEQGGVSSDGRGTGGVMLRKPTPSRPQLNMTPGLPLDTYTKNPDSSSGASSMSLVANFLTGHDLDNSTSFSSLLAGAITSDEKPDTDNGLNGRILSSAGGFAERLASRNSDSKSVGPAPIRPSTARFKSMPPSRLPIPKAPCVTIPPGLSPTTLLDSPVLLSSSHQPEPSPTTGTFPLPSLLSGSKPDNFSKEKRSDQDGGSSFVFKPFPKQPGSRNSLSPLGSTAPFSFPQPSIGEAQSQVKPQLSLVPAQPAASRPEKQRIVSEQNHTAASAPAASERSSDDGYNWRKYGQKLVKGSDNPRSYYKCTYVNCPMKRKVERSPDGQVTEIVYEGEHNHPKPQPTRRTAMSAAHLMSGTKALTGRNGTSEANRGQVNGSVCEQSSSSASDEDDDGPDAKRRKKEKLARESPPIPRTVREPRVVVQTTSEVDILDDGYRWRKYGQKVVKGNPHPRSYYKCTNLGCPVRKHVERACDDPRAVITTYEGKHNHDVPAARNSGHDRSTANLEIVPLPSTAAPTQSEQLSSDSALSVPTSVTSPELTAQTMEGESNQDGLSRVKPEQHEFSLGSPVIIPAVPISSSRPKDEDPMS